jgi:hypothetical protein
MHAAAAEAESVGGGKPQQSAAERVCEQSALGNSSSAAETIFVSSSKCIGGRSRARGEIVPLGELFESYELGFFPVFL